MTGSEFPRAEWQAYEMLMSYPGPAAVVDSAIPGADPHPNLDNLGPLTPTS